MFSGPYFCAAVVYQVSNPCLRASGSPRKVEGCRILLLMASGYTRQVLEPPGAISFSPFSQSTCVMGRLLRLNYALILTVDDLTAMK